MNTSASETFPAISLLYPDPDQTPASHSGSNLTADLNLRYLARMLALSKHYEKHIMNILLELTPDATTIRFRQAVLQDLLKQNDLMTGLQAVLDEIDMLEAYLNAPQWKENPLQQVAWRLSELSRFVDIVAALDKLLTDSAGRIQSEGLQRLRETMHAVHTSPLMQQLRDELPRLIPKVQNIRSISIGINLSDDLKPESATLLDIHTETFSGLSLMSRLFGSKKRADSEGLGPLHLRYPQATSPEMLAKLRDNIQLTPLFNDLASITNDISRPIVRALRQYTRISSRFLIALKTDIAFYLGAVRLVRRIRATGMAFNLPEIAPMQERIMSLDGLYNLNLLLQRLSRDDNRAAGIVTSDASFDESGRIFILTGPNQGGKTTYTQAIGLTQILAQAGLPVPATAARISPVDGIYTHFATEENPGLETGRLGEEARRLNQIFERATRHSLILLNESLASTSAAESLILGRDVIRALRLLGVRAIFATHLLDLAAECENLNQSTDGDSQIISVVSQVIVQEENSENPVQRTYIIKPGPPMQRSFAIELAARYGISYDQIKSLLKSRDAL